MEEGGGHRVERMWRREEEGGRREEGRGRKEEAGGRREEESGEGGREGGTHFLNLLKLLLTLPFPLSNHESRPLGIYRAFTGWVPTNNA